MVILIDILEGYCWTPHIVVSVVGYKLLWQVQQHLSSSPSLDMTKASHSMNGKDDSIITIMILAFVHDNNDDCWEGTYPSPLHDIHIHKQLLSQEEALASCELAQEYTQTTGQ
jgi:hypothetical protein